MMLSLIVFATAVAARVIDSVSEVPPGWKMLRTAQDSEQIGLRIALRQQRGEALEQAVIEMSTPGHPNYGMHLSRNELRSYTAPSVSAVSGVTAWLKEHGVSHDVDNDWITVSTTVQKANKLLSTSFAWFQYEDQVAKPKLRTLQVSVPDELADHIDIVQPTTRFGQLGPKRSTIFDVHYVDEKVPQNGKAQVDAAAAAAASCDFTSNTTPDCLRDLYDIKYTAKPDGNKVAFASYLEEYARYSDLVKFEDNYAPSAKGQNFTVVEVNGGLNDQSSSDDSGEANLDAQYILGISRPIPITEYSTGGRGPLVPTIDEPTQPGSNEPYLEFFTYLIAQDDAALPQTLSTSYGEEEQSVPRDYAIKVCNLIMQLGARGVSVIFSSGDSGPGNSCIRQSDKKVYFNPTFPAGCPYVTSVGAVIHSKPEAAVSFSSGGFSIYHKRPAYQDRAVPAYLKSIGNTYSGYFDKAGRGIPDVAAQGQGFAVYDKGRLGHFAGTSASAPTFAGVVALLNAARKSKGQPPLGFLNPFLYNNSAALTDITNGAGQGCQNTRYVPAAVFGKDGARWNATKGWDPSTGLGTPKFGKLLEAAAPGVKNA